MSIFVGSGVAAVTPFDEDKKVDFTTYEKLIDFLIENGADAIISCGTTGEASTLSGEEHVEAVRCAVSAVGGRVPLIAGAGSNHTDFGINTCRAVQKAGADACLLVTPYYNKTTQKGLIEHFTLMANSVDMPIMLYNVPSRTSLNMTPQTAYELSKVENIIALKESSGDITQVAEIAALCGDRLALYSGNDDQVVPLLSLGGKGVVSVMANIAPKQSHDMVMKFLEGDIAGSLKMQLEALPLIKALFCEVSPIPVKAALNLMGMHVGGYRLPLTDMEPDHLELLKKEMVAYGLI